MSNSEWVEPKTNYVATDQVTPNIFNTLGNDVKYLNDNKTGIEYEHPNGTVIMIERLVFVEE